MYGKSTTHVRLTKNNKRCHLQSRRAGDRAMYQYRQEVPSHFLEKHPWLYRPGAGTCFFLLFHRLPNHRIIGAAKRDFVLGGAARQINTLQHWIAFPKVQLGLALSHTQEIKRVSGVANTAFFLEATRKRP